MCIPARLETATFQFKPSATLVLARIGCFFGLEPEPQWSPRALESTKTVKNSDWTRTNQMSSFAPKKLQGKESHGGVKTRAPNPEVPDIQRSGSATSLQLRGGGPSKCCDRGWVDYLCPIIDELNGKPLELQVASQRKAGYPGALYEVSCCPDEGNQITFIL